MNEQALNFGRWLIYKKILFAKMGSKMKQKLEQLQSKIELQRGMVHQFLEHRREKNEARMKEKESKSDEKSNNSGGASEQVIDSAMESVLQTVIDLINLRKPVSDDLLLLCWQVCLVTPFMFFFLGCSFALQTVFICLCFFVLFVLFVFQYEITINKKHSYNFNPLNTRLWRCIESVLAEILELPLNKKDFIWFKSYLFDSAVLFLFFFQSNSFSFCFVFLILILCFGLFNTIRWDRFGLKMPCLNMTEIDY